MKRPVTPIAMPDVEPGAPATDQPECVWVAPRTLLVDEAYQRGLSERSIALIRRLVAGWDWRRFKPPIVVKTDAGFEVIDGQHTAIAAASHPLISLIPVMRVEAAEVADRAKAFLGHNKDRLNITATQMHHAAIAAGDEDALTIEQVCARAGVKILLSQPGQGRFNPCETMAVAAVGALINRWGAMKARQILQVLSDAQLEMLEAENALLRERVALLEREFLGADLVLPIEWRLTAQEQAVVAAILRREIATKEQIMIAVYGLRDDEPQEKIVDVFVCKARKKLAPFGVKIETVWGQGYRVAEPLRSEILRSVTPARGIAA